MAQTSKGSWLGWLSMACWWVDRGTSRLVTVVTDFEVRSATRSSTQSNSLFDYDVPSRDPSRCLADRRDGSLRECINRRRLLFQRKTWRR